MLIDWFTVLAQILNFLILVVLLKRFLYGPIIKAMQEREGRIAAAMENAEKAEKEANQRSAELAREKESFVSARETLLQEARKEVRDWQEKALQESREEVDRLRSAWMDRLTRDRRLFLQKLRTRVVDQIMAVSGKVLRDLADEDLERRVIRVFLEKMEKQKQDLSPERVSGRVLVRSGLELEEAHKQEIGRRLSGLFPKASSVDFEAAPVLGLGVHVMAGDRKVEWNLSDYLEELEQEILAELSTATGETS